VNVKIVWMAIWTSSGLLPPHPFRFHIHGLCLEWLWKNSENLSTVGVLQRFKPDTLQIQVLLLQPTCSLLQ
jgi:hypothetical protein